MGLRMASPVLVGNVYWFRKAVPETLRPLLKKREEKFSLGTRDPAEAKVKFARALAEVEERWARLRKGAVELTHKQSHAIAGQIYRELVAEHADNPDFEGRLGAWLHDAAALGIAKVVRISKNDAMVDRALQAIAERRKTRLEGRINAFLIREGYQLHPESKATLFKHVGEAVLKAREKLNAMADRGDYGPDPEAAKFPAYESPLQTASSEQQDGANLLSAVVDAWIAEKGRSAGTKKRAAWSKGSARDYERAARRFIELVGDKPISAYRKADARKFKEAYLSLPRTDYIKKQFAGLSFPEIVSRAEKAIREAHGDGAALPFVCVDEVTVNKNLGFVQALWNWAQANYDDVPPSIFDGMKVKGQTDAVDQRDSFSIDELQAILNAPLFLGCKSDKSWRTKGEYVPHRHGIYWVPLIGLFTGARSGEIIQLDVDDLILERGRYYFKITNERKGQSLKNKTSVRNVPVHPMLLELGLTEYVQAMRKIGARMFPDFPRATDGYYSTAYSRRFKLFLESIGVKTEKNSFHSFRHTFKDEAIDADISLAIVNRIQGHSNGGMAARYGSGRVRLSALDREFEKLDFAELDFTKVLDARWRK